MGIDRHVYTSWIHCQIRLTGMCETSVTWKTFVHLQALQTNHQSLALDTDQHTRQGP